MGLQCEKVKWGSGNGSVGMKQTPYSCRHSLELPELKEHWDTTLRQSLSGPVWSQALDVIVLVDVHFSTG